MAFAQKFRQRHSIAIFRICAAKQEAGSPDLMRCAELFSSLIFNDPDLGFEVNPADEAANATYLAVAF